MARKGRPTLSKKLRKINFGFTASPQLGGKLKKIKGSKSPFLAAILTALPEEFIDYYNQDPEKFLSDTQSFKLCFDR